MELIKVNRNSATRCFGAILRSQKGLMIEVTNVLIEIRATAKPELL